MRNERLNYLKQAVKDRLDIEDVVGSWVDLDRSNKGICPFHNDKTKGSFHVDNRKGKYKCFSCGAGGDVIDFISHMENKSFKDVVYSEAYKLGLISNEEYTTRKVDNNYVSKTYVSKVKKVKFEDLPLTKEEIERNHLVYEEYTKLCGLSPKHTKTLLEERQLKRHRLNDYFTLTKEFNKIDELIKRCNLKGYTKEDIAKVPGFYLDGNELKASNRLTGIGIKLRDHNGYIRALQIRRDWVGSSDSRYNYISSASKGGTKAQLYCDVIIPQRPSKTLFITEGKFKAEVLLDTFNAVVVSIPGINTWEGRLKEACESVVQRYNIKHLYVIFDADSAYNLEVYKQSKKMLNEELKDITFKNEFIAYWNVDFGKGVDDMIIAGHKDKLKKLPKNEYIAKYEEFKDYIELNCLEKDKEFMKNMYNKMFF